MLKFASFTSDIELSFYASLASYKINHDKLDDSARRVLGLYEIRPAENPAASCRMQLHGNALTSDDVASNYYRAEGVIRNFNTIEDYRNSDKSAILDRAAKTIWDAILDGTIFSCPSLLAHFTIICFSDLKKYKFTYLFAYPALHSEPSWTVLHHDDSSQESLGGKAGSMNRSVGKRLSADDSSALVEAVQTWRYSVDARQWGFFLARKVPVDDDTLSDQQDRPGSAAELGSPTKKNKWLIASLGQYESGFFDGSEELNRLICFADPSTYEDHPGWPLRNLLILARKRWKLTQLSVLCYRDIHARRHEARSFIMRLSSPAAGLDMEILEMPKATGWERGPSGKVVGKVANLGEYMDPAKLADQAVDLNLKLIKWRIAPSLDLEVVKNTKCLLLGAGTLGSYVSRNLMGWGVRKITFVDNGFVSFSNPVRQPLYNFEDCLGGGVPKAERAAAALKEIYPGVESSGYNMSVPMPGHPAVEGKTREEFELLVRLFTEHDVVFLLMDSRESRWLPTVLGKAMGKLVMNAALGFDTYVVMRHGTTNSQSPDKELGCYFCNDVVAPVNSLADRTLDQQCTVTRPGVAAIASALLVELAVSVLQEKPIDNIAGDGQEHPLGMVPHTLRGFLSNWTTINVTGKSYEQCSACSPKIVETYRKQGWDFVKSALDEKDYVAELSGLAELQRQAEKASDLLDWDEGEESHSEGLDEEGEMI